MLGVDDFAFRRSRTYGTILLDLDVLIASARDRRPRQIDPYRPYIQQRFTDGCTNATQIYREIREHGFRGNHQAVASTSAACGVAPQPPKHPGRSPARARSPPGSCAHATPSAATSRPNSTRPASPAPTSPPHVTWPASSPAWSATAAATSWPPGSARPRPTGRILYGASPGSCARTGTPSSPA